MAFSTDWVYSKTVNEQENPNLTAKRENWSDMVNAVGDTPLYARSTYIRKISKYEKGKPVYTYTVPEVLSVADFQLDIPTNAYITNVIIECCYKVENGIDVPLPMAEFMSYGGSGQIVYQSQKGKDGWYDGIFQPYYRDYESQKIGTSDTIVQYVLPGSEWNKRGYSTSQLNKSIFGADIFFSTPKSMSSDRVNIYIKWGRVKVEYELFDPYVQYTPSNNANNPIEGEINKNMKVCATFGNRSHVNGGTKVLDVELPFATELSSYTVENSVFEHVEDNHYHWICDGSAFSKNNLCLNLKGKTIGLKTIDYSLGEVKFNPAYIYPYATEDRNYGLAKIESGDITCLKPSCFFFTAKVSSVDDTIAFGVNLDGNNLADPNNTSQEFKDLYNNSEGTGNYLISWTLNQESLSKGITIDEEHTSNVQITFNIPSGEEVEIKWAGCFMPVTEGANTLILKNKDTNESISYDYVSNNYIEKEYRCITEDLIWEDHRVLTSFETDGFIIPCAVRTMDKVMVEEECNLRAYFQLPISYIGCVPLKHPHFDPQSDFTNDGLKETYKNKTYMGKTGEIDERISLNIRVPPQDVTTFQGLAEMDKPVPVNTVPEAFEGDALNHRGWVELTKVSAEKTNPLYYKTELEVDYLTHNINTRFQILKGNQTYKYSIPSMVSPVLRSGDEFAKTSYINEDGEEVYNRDGYFIVDTDGAYVFDKDSSENKRAMFGLNNAQYLHIRSEDPMPTQAKISCDWSSTKINEDRENNVSRVFRLYNSKNVPIFEYEYCDFNYEVVDEYYTCQVIARVKDSENHWRTVINHPLNLAIDLQSLNLVKDLETSKFVQRELTESEIREMAANADDDLFIYNDYTYGSTLHMELSGNNLTLIEEGFNGQEIYKKITLPKSNYYYDVYWKNYNTDGETNEVVSFFDFEVSESIVASEFDNLYGDMYISSFPLKDKQLLFTRVSEEGTIYYWKEDNNPFTYIQEPFYMYFCGVDLKTDKGISLFNLNNSYTTFYLVNGLVRAGFNRLNGEVYISKYDTTGKRYVNVAQLQLHNYSDFSIGAFSDDKIEVKAGSTVFTMYRGHPYIVVNHPEEDMAFETIWNRAWVDSINGYTQEFPVLWELFNHNNQLPSCIGGENLKISCAELSDVENTHPSSTNLSLTQTTTPAYSFEDTIFTISGSVTNVDEIISTSKKWRGAFGIYTSETSVNNDVPYKVTLFGLPKTAYDGQIITLKSKTVDYAGNPVKGKTSIFFDGNNVELGRTTTNKNGIAMLDVEVHAVSEYTVYAQWGANLKSLPHTFSMRQVTLSTYFNGVPEIVGSFTYEDGDFVCDPLDTTVFRQVSQLTGIPYNVRTENGVLYADEFTTSSTGNILSAEDISKLNKAIKSIEIENYQIIVNTMED